MKNSRYEIIEEDELPDSSQYEIVDDKKIPEKSMSEKYQDFMNPNKVDREGNPMIETFIGRMPRKVPEFQPGTPENKKLLEELVGIGAGMPGMNVLSQGLIKGAKLVPGVVSKGYENIKNTIGNARKDKSLHEKLSMEATNEHGLAEKLSEPVKPGLYPTPISELQNIENEIGKHINIEGEHGARISSSINNRIKSVEDFWSDAYKRLEEKIKNNNFHMPEQAMENISYDVGDIFKRIKQGADPKKVLSEIKKEQKNPFYEELIKTAPTSSDRSAADFLAKHREFRDTLGGLKSDLKSEKYGSLEKKQIKEAIEKAKGMESEIKNTLNEGLGNFKPEYDWIMKGYSEQVFPLRKNPLVKSAKKGKMSEDIIHDLRTNESGMLLLKDLMKQDPEVLRNLIGQAYLKKPSSIHAPNEVLREYIDEMPQFKELIKQKEKALEETAKRKDITLKEKLRTEKELEDIKKSRKKLLIGIGSIGGASIGAAGIKKASKLFSND